MVSVLRSPESYKSNNNKIFKNPRNASQDASMSYMDGAISENDPQ